LTRPRLVTSALLAQVFLLLLLAAGVAAADEGLDAAKEQQPQLVSDEAARQQDEEAAHRPDAPQHEQGAKLTDVAAPPQDQDPVHQDEERQVETREQKGGFIGYNYLAKDGHGGRAEEYGFLHSSRSGGLFYRNLQKDGNFDLEGSFLNEHDYHGDLALDYRGDYRLHLRTESLFHNLDRELLFTDTFTSARTDAPTLADYRSAQDPPFDYGVSVTQDNAEFRYRLHNYPMHVNLGYWRLVREGTIQQRFADTAFEGSPNTIHAQARSIDQETQEGHLGVDAHLGPIDVIYDFRVRVFEDKGGIPVADYVARTGLGGAPEVVGGPRQHNENPDSSLISHTLRLHSSLAGGFVASGSYSIEQRENLSHLSDTTGAKHISTFVQNGATDLVYTPSQYYSLAVKFRRQQLDNDNRGGVVSANFADPVQTVKPPIDFEKEIILAVLSYRPRRDLSVTGEYRGEFLNRSNVSAVPTLTTWGLPENSATSKGSLAIYYRPGTGTRLSADYSYTSTDHPSYGTSFQQRHEGKLLATYTRNSNWGATANVIIRRESNDDVEHFLINAPLADPVTFSPSQLLSRDKRTENANIAAWVMPFGRLNISANYAFLQTRVDQGILFTSFSPGSFAASQYLSRSHVYGVSSSYPVTGKLDLSLMLQQTRSISSFDPQSVTFTPATPTDPGSSTSGIGDITRQHTVISQLSTRGEYRFTPTLSTTLEYVVRDYDEKNPAYSAYNGTVHTVFATVAAKW
jgi:hypothetical protein